MSVLSTLFPIISPSHMVQWALCKKGVGVCIMMDEVGFAEPVIHRILPDLPSIPVPIWLVCHRELQTSHRIQLAEGLA